MQEWQAVLLALGIATGFVLLVYIMITLSRHPEDRMWLNWKIHAALWRFWAWLDEHKRERLEWRRLRRGLPPTSDRDRFI